MVIRWQIPKNFPYVPQRNCKPTKPKLRPLSKGIIICIDQGYQNIEVEGDSIFTIGTLRGKIKNYWWFL